MITINRRLSHAGIELHIDDMQIALEEISKLDRQFTGFS